jgi:hypothetical protein
LAIVRLGKHTLRQFALKALEGVGDSSLGQWEEWSSDTGVYHVRRRLAAVEAERVGPPRDIRGTPDAKRRVEHVMALYPKLPAKWFEADL